MNVRKRQILFYILFLLITSPLLLVSIYFKDQSLDPSSKAGEELPPDISGLPTVVSVPPQVAYEGAEFSYILKIVDSDTTLDKITVTIEDAPGWLRIREKFELYGVPQFGSSNTEKITLKISDGDSIIEESFYLLIKESE